MNFFSGDFWTVMEYSLGKFLLLKKTWDTAKGIFLNTRNLIKSLRKSKQVANYSVQHIINELEATPNVIIPVNSLRGDLAPLVELKKFDSESFLDVAHQIKTSIESAQMRTGPNSLLIASKAEWLSYGASMQSNDDGDIQILQISEVEEAINIPVIISKNNWLSNYSQLLSGAFAHEARLSGGLVSLEAEILPKLIGLQNVNKLKLQGRTSVLIADEELVNLAGIDIDVKPEILIKTQSKVFLGFLWVIYIDRISLDYCPIFEYGNLGEKCSYDLLKDKLIHQIEFYKKKVWFDWDKKKEDRRFILSIAINDQLITDIQNYFDDVCLPDARAEVLRKVLSA